MIGGWGQAGKVVTKRQLSPKCNRSLWWGSGEHEGPAVQVQRGGLAGRESVGFPQVKMRHKRQLLACPSPSSLARPPEYGPPHSGWLQVDEV